MFDWTTNSNILTIGAQELGTGTARNVRLSGGASVGIWSAGTEYLRAAGGRTYFINSTPTASAYLIDTSSDNTGIYKVANGVLGIGPFSLTFYQWAGQSRVTSNFDTGNSTTLANITGLTTTLTAGRTYSFSAIIPTTSNVAAGVKFAIAGTATATDITYEAIVYSAGAVVAQTRASALATTVGAVTAVTAAYCQITGTITVNAGGTLTIQMAQNVGNATGSVALRGSSLFVYDMP